MPSQVLDPHVEAERLRHIRALIEDLLHTFDVCGQVVLAGRGGRFENFSDIRASWSCARLVETGDGRTGIGLRSQLADYGGDVERQKQELEWTLGMISGFGQIGGEMAVAWFDASQALDKATNAEHTPLHRDDPRDAP